jgi:folylpolyglutamate synthase
VWYLDGAHTEESMAQCAEWFCDVTTDGRQESGKLDATAKESATQTGDDAEEGPSPAESDGSANAAASPASPATPATPLTPEPPPPVRVLLFNCMEERDPRTLLAPLAKTLRDRRAPLTHPALFAPAESSSKGLKPDTAAAEDLAWQNKMVRVWDDLARKHPGASLLSVAPPDGGEPGGGGGADGPRDAPGDSVPEPEPETSASSARAAAGVAAAAVPSLRQAVEKIRSVASEQRRLKTGRRVHVLVAGSLYLVGDMLRVLGRA